jgi:hypothetical protein
MNIFETMKRDATQLESGLLFLKKDVPQKERTHLMIWKPKATKPYFNYLVKPEMVEKTISEAEQALLEHKKQVAERREKAKSINNSVMIGEIFYSSWGYDQTNIDFYQVIKKTPKTITVRRIRSKSEPAYTMACYVMPIKDSFLDSDHPYDTSFGSPMVKKLSVFSDGQVYFKPASYSIATIWDGTRKTETYTG